MVVGTRATVTHDRYLHDTLLNSLLVVVVSHVYFLGVFVDFIVFGNASIKISKLVHIHLICLVEFVGL